MDLTGKWKQVGGAASDSGEYFFRQAEISGQQHFFFHGHQIGGDAWSNAFQGIINGSEITGVWCDLPGANNRGSGPMTLAIDDENTVTLKSASGFGGRKWVRQTTG